MITILITGFTHDMQTGMQRVRKDLTDLLSTPADTAAEFMVCFLPELLPTTPPRVSATVFKDERNDDPRSHQLVTETIAHTIGSVVPEKTIVHVNIVVLANAEQRSLVTKGPIPEQ